MVRKNKQVAGSASSAKRIKGRSRRKAKLSVVAAKSLGYQCGCLPRASAGGYRWDAEYAAAMAEMAASRGPDRVRAGRVPVAVPAERDD